jgi:hypothetical protein
MRFPTEPITDMLCDVIYTSRKAKLVYAIKNGIAVDIWIDDSPAWLFDDAASASLYLCTNSTSFFSSTVTSTCKSFLYYFKQFS